ncbi:MAG: hypothetical protein LDL41_09055 [Coleofasciculus sp. S288]|nr:hypothetical protein [Coleofasciculus sp. S288]
MSPHLRVSLSDTTTECNFLSVSHGEWGMANCAIASPLLGIEVLLEARRSNEVQRFYF